MLTITARLVHGTIRAGSPDDTVMAGGDPVGEWPPSPARLFSALVAAEGTGNRCRVTDGSELSELERLEPPTIYADTLADVIDTKLVSRFVVREGTSKSTVQNYPARQATLFHPGILAAPRHPRVEYVWDAEPSPKSVVALARRAARVGYLGCSDSPVTLTVQTGHHESSLPAWTAGSTGVGLPVPYPGFLDALDAAFESWSSGQPSKRSWIPSRRVRYSVARLADPASLPTVFWLQLKRPQSARRTKAISEILRSALLAGVDAELGGNERSGERVPWVFHGHDVPSTVTRPYQLVRCLPLANVGYPHSDGSVHGFAVWLPPGIDGTIIEATRSALFRRVQHLHGKGVDVGIDMRREEAGAWSTNPRRWTGPSRMWFSTTPAVVERGRRGGPTSGDVRQWFANAGYPEPSSVHISAVPTRTGVPRLQPFEIHREGKDRHPYVWLEVGFEEPIEGPLCVGRSRSFGMGVLAPLDQNQRGAGKGGPR